MDEARAVIERLQRIEALEREGTHPRTLLAEVQALLREAEAWLEAEGGPDRAAEALDRCRAAVALGAACGADIRTRGLSARPSETTGRCASSSSAVS